MTHVYWLESKFEFLKLLRLRAYSLSTVLFPVMFYCFFGLAMGGSRFKGMGTMSSYLLATYGAFAVVGSTLFAFGVGIAVERGLGWLQVKQASPMPAMAYFLAKGFVSMAFGGIVVALLFFLGAAFGGVTMPAGQWLALGGVLIAGAIPFCALGLAIAAFAQPNSAAGIVNLIYLPLGFLSGLWMPIEFLPNAIKQIARFLPTYHFGQIALGVLGVPLKQSALLHVGALAAFTAVFAAIAYLGMSRRSERMYG